MKQTRTLSTTARWTAVLVAAAAHPALLVLLFPLVGERANLSMVIAPFAAVWLLNLRLGLGVLLLNTVSTAVVFGQLTNAGPREGLSKAFAAFCLVSLFCLIVDRIRRYVDKGKAMRAEVERMRTPNP